MCLFFLPLQSSIIESRPSWQNPGIVPPELWCAFLIHCVHDYILSTMPYFYQADHDGKLHSAGVDLSRSSEGHPVIVHCNRGAYFRPCH